MWMTFTCVETGRAAVGSGRRQGWAVLIGWSWKREGGEGGSRHACYMHARLQAVGHARETGCALPTLSQAGTTKVKVCVVPCRALVLSPSWGTAASGYGYGYSLPVLALRGHRMDKAQHQSLRCSVAHRHGYRQPRFCRHGDGGKATKNTTNIRRRPSRLACVRASERAAGYIVLRLFRAPTSGNIPTMKVFFHELMAIMPRSWKPGDNPLTATAPPRAPPPNPPPGPRDDDDGTASVQLGKTQSAGMGPAAPNKNENWWNRGGGGVVGKKKGRCMSETMRDKGATDV